MNKGLITSLKIVIDCVLPGAANIDQLSENTIKLGKNMLQKFCPFWRVGEEICNHSGMIKHIPDQCNIGHFHYAQVQPMCKAMNVDC